MTFEELIRRSRKEGESPYGGSLLCLDPGHTTGWALFEGTNLIGHGQINTGPDSGEADNLREVRTLFQNTNPDECVFEDYRVYKWRAAQHANSDLHTPKLIGMIQVVCIDFGLQYHKQMAYVAKQFATDAKLREWNFYAEGMKHARDAIRHGCYFIAFGTADNPQGRRKRVGRNQRVG